MNKKILSFCLILFLFGCGKIEEAGVAIKQAGVATKDIESIKEERKKVEEKLRRIEAEQRLQSDKAAAATKQVEDKAAVAKQRIEELEKRNNSAIDGIKWIVVLIAVGGFLSILYKPSRNLLQRSLFKNFSYKPRKFDKDKR